MIDCRVIMSLTEIILWSLIFAPLFRSNAPLQDSHWCWCADARCKWVPGPSNRSLARQIDPCIVVESFKVIPADSTSRLFPPSLISHPLAKESTRCEGSDFWVWIHVWNFPDFENPSGIVLGEPRIKQAFPVAPIT